MDALGLLLATLALLVYPGGLYLAAGSWLTARVGRLPAGRAPASRLDWFAVGLAAVATSMAPLPGSPAASLPPPAGVAPNLVAAGVLLAAAIAIGSEPPWRTGRLISALAISIPLTLIALGAASLSLPDVSAATGGALTAARAVVAATMLMAAPLVCGAHGATALPARSVATCAVALFAFSLLAPPSLRGWTATAAALSVLAATALYALLLRALRGAVWRRHTGLSIVCAAAGAAAAVLALVGAQP